jgi:hypothetical protein
MSIGLEPISGPDIIEPGCCKPEDDPKMFIAPPFEPP